MGKGGSRQGCARVGHRSQAVLSLERCCLEGPPQLAWRDGGAPNFYKSGSRPSVSRKKTQAPRPACHRSPHPPYHHQRQNRSSPFCQGHLPASIAIASCHSQAQIHQTRAFPFSTAKDQFRQPCDFCFCNFGDCAFYLNHHHTLGCLNLTLEDRWQCLEISHSLKDRRERLARVTRAS